MKNIPFEPTHTILTPQNIPFKNRTQRERERERERLHHLVGWAGGFEMYISLSLHILLNFHNLYQGFDIKI